jgi:hypothetical protein
MSNPLGNGRPRPAKFIMRAAAIAASVALAATGASARSGVRSQAEIAPAGAPRDSYYSQSAPTLVQDSDGDVDSGVPPDQVEKYVAVYKDMQHNRSLTVDTAATKEGLSVAEFRQLEQKIERDEDAREHVRTELQGDVEDKP